MITVVHPPGASDPIHRHKAHAFLYVLEVAIVMQVKGGKEIALTQGKTFYKGPIDIHAVAGTQIAQDQRSSSCSLLRARTIRCWCRSSETNNWLADGRTILRLPGATERVI